MWRKILLFVSLGLNVILFYALIWGETGALAYRNMKAQFTSLDSRIAAIAQKNELTLKEIKLLKTDVKYQEKMIRNRLNFVKSNEILYIFPSDSETEAVGAPDNETKN